jgi:Cu(I)/Ag(I) efflux system membrane protein CusA/SilA
LRSEEENWIVRSFINIYKPLLTWALPRWNLVMWMFAVLLILAAGMFPLQAIIGQGASEIAWKASFLAVFAAVTGLTVIFTRGWYWQLLSFASLLLIALWAYQFPKIGVAFMPALDEGTTLDMPITVPRASVTQAADDLKARDALLRGFPEVESVIGKAGRADTPTDPAPLDMVETFVNYRPKQLWPKRVLKYSDAAEQTRHVLDALTSGGFVANELSADDRQSLINDAAQKALERFDETMREFSLLRYAEFDRELEPLLTRFAVAETVQQVRVSGQLRWPAGALEQAEVDRLVAALTPEYGAWLARNPALEDATEISRDIVAELAAVGAIEDEVAALQLQQSRWKRAFSAVSEALGAKRHAFADELLRGLEAHRMELWDDRVHQINWELFDRGVETFTWCAIEELLKAADGSGLTKDAPHSAESQRFVHETVQAQLGRPVDESAIGPLIGLREDLEKQFAEHVFFWPRQTGPKGDLVDDEMGRVLQVPGWSNIFTQPIINRIEMLSTGVRTDIGVKVFGPDLDTIDRVGKEIEAVLKPVSGARDVIAAPIMGKGYVQIDIDRKQAARYGISVEDIQNEIEVALAGRAVTYTVEKRDRFPVRVRYARSDRRDEESIRRLLISAGGMSNTPSMSDSTTAGSMAGAMPTVPEGDDGGDESHTATPQHVARGKPLIPLAAMADVRIVEGPAMIKSENGRLLNYVTLNVRGRDIVGFVEEAQRVVTQKIKLPEGVHIEWSGEFEHQVRAARTLRIVFPAVVLLIFVILYLTYHDLADAALMMLAVPEALAGGAFFMYFFPKIMHGWDAPPMDFSVAVWVGFIACFGMATETGIIMLVYLREAIEKRGGLENIGSLEELRQAVIEGAVHRLRPKLLTEGVAIIAIFPMVFAKGVGGEILAPMALPVLGGLLISDEVVDLFLPVRFYWIRRARWLKLQEEKNRDASANDRSVVQAELASVV